ncbi:17413_t:CDS:2 [Funneliformis geosporum]|uniref:17413_t:CDS:1 n=1 Tax=Funneliformis geosporum TaxID=1117311 RepID=A0A9W4SVZ9_9GLOM|nr:17413_t:CDS:2 [Funneliformis geosporum]
MFTLRNFGTRSLKTRIIRNTATIKLPQKALFNNYSRHRYDEIARVAKPAPLWEASAVVDGVIKPLSLKDYISKFLVMIFYPMDWTFVCPTEMVAFSDNIQKFKDINTEVVGISCDSPHSHIAWEGTFIIDDKGILRVAHVNDTQIGRSVNETLRLVEAIQFANKHGEVCPVNWKSGDRTIVPDPKLSKDYFSQI